MARSLAILPALFCSALLCGAGENVEVSATGALGVSGGEDQSRKFTAGGGASVKWPATGKHGLQFDYFFASAPSGEFNRNFFTGSYVMQQRSGRARAFFQVGLGVMRATPRDRLTMPRSVDSDFAAILGVGFTIDLRGSLFIRPGLRVYGYAGPSVAVLPSVSLGWRF
jgi:hypothetical protein